MVVFQPVLSIPYKSWAGKKVVVRNKKKNGPIRIVSTLVLHQLYSNDQDKREDIEIQHEERDNSDKDGGHQ